MTDKEFPLGKAGVDFLEPRGIDIEIAIRHLVHTCRADSDYKTNKLMVPDAKGTILAFPFVDHGKIVNTKYRSTGSKKFWQSSGGTATFYGADIMDDSAIISGEQPLTIVEGECDKLVVESNGNPFVVSVPEGAPPPSPDHAKGEVRSGSDEAGKFRFMWNNRERLSRIKRFILAVDNDPPGKRLSDELIRRLLASRCLTVKYPDGCKDPNDIIIKGHGGAALIGMLNDARLLPIDGVYALSDYPERDFVTYRTGLPNLDKHFLLFEGQFTVITGTPGHGKSVLVTQIAVEVARLHGWNSLIFSPEMPVVPQYRERLRRVIGGGNVAADAFIEKHIRFIDHPPNAVDDGDIDVEEIIKRASEAVMRDDIRLVIVDPWNEIEHSHDPGENISDYCGRSIRAMRRAAQRHKLSWIVVAHPTKDHSKFRKRSKDGEEEAAPPVPTLYDIESSAHWFNKCDHGMIVHRSIVEVNGVKKDSTQVIVAKSRFAEAGERGRVVYSFDPVTLSLDCLDRDTSHDPTDNVPF